MAGANTTKYVDSRNHCPFGCTPAHLSEHGYCPHLKGFTNVGKVMECVTYDNRGVPHVGLKREPVLKTDRIVNPLKQIKDDQGVRSVPEWVSARVYRQVKEDEAKAWRAKHVAAAEEDSLVEADAV